MRKVVDCACNRRSFLDLVVQKLKAPCSSFNGQSAGSLGFIIRRIDLRLNFLLHGGDFEYPLQVCYGRFETGEKASDDCRCRSRCRSWYGYRMVMKEKIKGDTSRDGYRRR